MQKASPRTGFSQTLSPEFTDNILFLRFVRVCLSGQTYEQESSIPRARARAQGRHFHFLDRKFQKMQHLPHQHARQPCADATHDAQLGCTQMHTPIHPLRHIDRYAHTLIHLSTMHSRLFSFPAQQGMLPFPGACSAPSAQ